jgi:hypothetical protein
VARRSRELRELLRRVERPRTRHGSWDPAEMCLARKELALAYGLAKARTHRPRRNPLSDTPPGSTRFDAPSFTSPGGRMRESPRCAPSPAARRRVRWS